MDTPNHLDSRRLTPRCMQITEVPMPISSRAVRHLLAAPQSEQSTSGSDLGMLRELALQVWRLEKRIERIEPGTELKSKRPLEDSTGRLRDILDDIGITTEDPLGSPYTDGWIEVDVIAFEDPDGPPPAGSPDQWIKQTIRPIIRNKSDLLAKGEVIVAFVSQGDGPSEKGNA